MYQYQYPAPYELYHHGIKGQKWGVRRFFSRNNNKQNQVAKKRLSKEEKIAEIKKKRRRAIIGAIATLTVAEVVLPNFINTYRKGKAYVDVNNAVVDTYAKAKGLNEIKGRPTLGFAQVKRGKQMVNSMLNFTPLTV